MDAIEHRGHWWLPDKEDNRTAGVLEYDPDTGAKLELFDSIISVEGDPFESESISRLFGQDENGKYITLHNCNVRASKISGGGVNHVAYPEEIFIGAGLPELQFDKIKIQYPNLIEWLDDSSITTNIENGEKKVIPTTSVDFSDPIIVELEKYTLEIRSKVSFGSGEQNSIQYDESAIIELTCDGDVQFQEAREIIEYLQHYFALSIGGYTLRK